MCVLSPFHGLATGSLGVAMGPVYNSQGTALLWRRGVGLRVLSLLMCKHDGDGTHAQPPWPRNWQPPAPSHTREAAPGGGCPCTLLAACHIPASSGPGPWCRLRLCCWVAHATTLECQGSTYLSISVPCQGVPACLLILGVCVCARVLCCTQRVWGVCIHVLHSLCVRLICAPFGVFCNIGQPGRQ